MKCSPDTGAIVSSTGGVGAVVCSCQSATFGDGQLARAYPKMDWAPRWLRAKHTLTELSLDSALGFYRTITKVHHDQRRGFILSKASSGSWRLRPGESGRRADGSLQRSG